MRTGAWWWMYGTALTNGAPWWTEWTIGAEWTEWTIGAEWTEWTIGPWWIAWIGAAWTTGYDLTIGTAWTAWTNGADLMIGPELWTTWDDWYEEAIGAWAMTGPWETTGTRTPAETAAKMHETINYKFKITNKKLIN